MLKMQQIRKCVACIADTFCLNDSNYILNYLRIYSVIWLLVEQFLLAIRMHFLSIFTQSWL
jgi:hypothetical protein